MSGIPDQPSPSPSQPTAPPKAGCQRAPIIVLGVALALAILGSLFVFVGLPAIGCPKAGPTAPVGAVSDFCFTPFTSGSHSIGGLVAGPDGALWFTEPAHIGRLTPPGALTEFALPAPNAAPGAIVAGPDGNLWFVDTATKSLGRVTLQGVVTQFALPPGDTVPVGLAAGSDGALWYTRSPSAAAAGGPPNTTTPGLIGRMTVGGTATEFTVPNPPAPRPPAQPRDIVAGPDGALWFDTGVVGGVAVGNSWIGRISTAGQVSLVYTPDPRALVGITAIAAGPGHALWFTQSSNNINAIATPGVPPTGGPGQQTGSIGRLTPSGALTLFPLPSSLGTFPGAITASSDGNLWFGAGGGKIGRITPSGQVAAFPIPDPQAEIGPLTAGPGAAVWFAQVYPDVDLLNGLVWGTKIGRIVV